MLSVNSSIQLPQTQRTFTNFAQANWAGFIRESEDDFALLPLPTSCSEGKRVFRRMLLKASKHNIPSGFRKDFVPDLPPNAKHLITQRDALRDVDSTDPNITRLKTEILAAILAGKRARWKEKIESCNFRNNQGKYWSLLKSLSGKSAGPPPNQPISFKGKVQFKDKDIALKFCKQYTTVIPHKSSKDIRRVLRQMRLRHKLDNNFSPFTVKNVEAAISHSKN
jgi:hypothetical protein